MQFLSQELRYAIRSLLKHPAFTTVVVIVLGLGIGANTAIFSIVNAVMLRPLPYADSDQLVMVREHLPKLFGPAVNLSGAELLDYRDGNSVFSQSGAFTDLKVNLTGASDTQRVQGARVSASLFPMLGVAPALGRNFLAEEDQPGTNHVVMLSDGLWRSQFGGDPSIIGKSATVDDQPYTIVGVMPPSFEFPYRDQLMQQ